MPNINHSHHETICLNMSSSFCDRVPPNIDSTKTISGSHRLIQMQLENILTLRGIDDIHFSYLSVSFS